MKNIRVAFYTEAGSKRGMGHLVRCYAIYAEFKSRGISSSFFLDSDIDFDYKFSDISYFKWSSFTLNNVYDVVFIDSYEADIEVYNKVSNSVEIAVFIDDYERLSYPKGIVINFAPDANELFFHNRNQSSTYLLGLKYIPIRKKILTAQKIEQEQIFIMLGGNDIENLSQTIIEALKDINIKKVIVVNDESIAKILQNYQNVTVLYKVSDDRLSLAMASSSIAISTASMVLYELAYLKVPTLIFAVNENQIIGSAQLLKHNLATALLNFDDKNWVQVMKKHILLLNKTNNYVNKAIDEKGTQRIAETTIRMIKE